VSLSKPPELDHLRVVLVATRNPLNIGAAARAMSNFGCAHLRVVNPYEPAFREARSAVGASSVLAAAEQFKTVAEAVADCTLVVGTTAVRTRELQHQVRRLEDGARLIRRRLGASRSAVRPGVGRGAMQLGESRVALMFGSEKTGLSNADLSHCNWLMRIPTHEKNISMNLGQAVAVCLYELVRDPKAARQPEKLPLAAAAEVERITAVLLEGLHVSGYLTLRRVSDAEERIRRLVRRLHLPARDSIIWLGILRQMLWKMRSGSDKDKEKDNDAEAKAAHKDS
jgi:TrmH family RNA methyltransferase